MSELIDNAVVLLFILFLLFIFRGYHLNRLKQMDSKSDTDLGKQHNSVDSHQD